MSQAYSDPKRESDPYALPDIEVWFVGAGPHAMATCPGEHEDYYDEHGRNRTNHAEHIGWYWQSCFPGDLPDSDPVGPFATEAEALADAQGRSE